MAKAKKSRELKSSGNEADARPVGRMNVDRPPAGKQEINITRDQLLGSFDVERSKYEAVARRLNMILSGQFEISTTIEALDEIEKSGKGNKIMVPLGAGIMAEAELESNNEVMFSFAGGAITKKKIPEIRDELKKRLGALKKEYDATAAERVKIEKGLSNIRNIIMLAENNARAQAAGKGQGNV